MKKINCWEFKKCGRESGGNKVHELGVCPSSVTKEVDGIHHGVNGGRCCWAISRTLCKGKIAQEMKMNDCLRCDFYQTVRKEEGPNFFLIHDIYKKLGQK